MAALLSPMNVNFFSIRAVSNGRYHRSVASNIGIGFVILCLMEALSRAFVACGSRASGSLFISDEKWCHLTNTTRPPQI